MEKQPDVSIIVPVYNEEQTVEAVIRMLIAINAGITKEIIVVDDGSTDDTRRILKKFIDNKEVKIVYKKNNGGKGSAVQIGIKKALGKVIAIQDADLEYDPNDLPALVNTVLRGEAKVVYGSRFKGKIMKMTFLRNWANKFLTWFTNILYGSKLSDACTCYKIFDANLLRDLDLEVNGFNICHEMTAKCLKRKYPIKEMPINYCARAVSEGVKSTWKDLIKAIRAIVELKINTN